MGSMIGALDVKKAAGVTGRPFASRRRRLGAFGYVVPVQVR
jgi:hypothetical protein